MDPDGLTLIILALLGALCLVLCYSTGAVCADDSKKDRITQLGVSHRTVGFAVLFLVGCAFFISNFVSVFPPRYYFLWLVAGAVVFTLLLVTCFCVGLAKGKYIGSSVAKLVGVLACAPAHFVFRSAKLSAVSDVTAEELLEMVDDVEEQDLIDETQKEMITNIFELDDVTAENIMTHRTEMLTLPDTATVAQAVAFVQEHGFSRIPVYHKNIDDILGILYAKDLFDCWERANGENSIHSFVRKAMFVPESCLARDLLREFKVKRMQIAIVVDEYGGTAGMVSMEDVLEEIVGNIQDEFDDEEEDIVAVSDGVLAVGGADLEDVFDALGVTMPEPDEEHDFDTVGGVIVELFGRFPKEGEFVSVTYAGVDFSVIEAKERRVTKAKCSVHIDIAQEQTGEAD